MILAKDPPDEPLWLLFLLVFTPSAMSNEKWLQPFCVVVLLSVPMLTCLGPLPYQLHSPLPDIFHFNQVCHTGKGNTGWNQHWESKKSMANETQKAWQWSALLKRGGTPLHCNTKLSLILGPFLLWSTFNQDCVQMRARYQSETYSNSLYLTKGRSTMTYKCPRPRAATFC